MTFLATSLTTGSVVLICDSTPSNSLCTCTMIDIEELLAILTYNTFSFCAFVALSSASSSRSDLNTYTYPVRHPYLVLYSLLVKLELEVLPHPLSHCNDLILHDLVPEGVVRGEWW